MVSAQSKNGCAVYDQNLFKDLRDAKLAARTCKNCPLWERATQTVFGEGPVPASLMLVGEQPGDREDARGAPFVGPAGKLLDDALEQAGIDRSLAYVTNAVKHFKWEPSGRRRLHKKPSAREIEACRPWLLTEIEFVRPRVIVSLGATAAASLLGKDFRISGKRGQFVESLYAPKILVTVHPAAILRILDKRMRDMEFRHFVEDLSIVQSWTTAWM